MIKASVIQSIKLISLFGIYAILLYKMTIAWISLLKKYKIMDYVGRSNGLTIHDTTRGGGLLFVGASVLMALLCGLVFCKQDFYYFKFAVIGILTLIISVIFFIEDVKKLSIGTRLLTQFCFACTGYIIMFNEVSNVLSFLPYYAQPTLYIIGSMWFMNLYNFMDGIDLLTAVETICITAGLIFFYTISIGVTHIAQEESAMQIIHCLCIMIAMFVFIIFNKTPAQLFIGDSGSIAIGFIVSMFLTQFANDFGLQYAIILPLYYIMDATITLLKRIAAGEKFWLPQYGRNYFHMAKLSDKSATSIVSTVGKLNIGMYLIIFVNTKYINLNNNIILLVCATLTMFLLLQFQKAYQIAMLRKAN